MHQVVQIWDQQRFGTVLCEVDESSSCMRLHPRVTLVFHCFKQSGNHLKCGWIIETWDLFRDDCILQQSIKIVHLDLRVVGWILILDLIPPPPKLRNVSFLFHDSPYHEIFSGRLGQSLWPFAQWHCRQHNGPLGAEHEKHNFNPFLKNYTSWFFTMSSNDNVR